MTRDQAARLEVWLFWTEKEARVAGFRDRAHPADPTMLCWTPSRGIEGVRGLRPRRVVSVLGNRPPPDRKAAEVAASVCVFLQERMPEVWVEV